MSPLTDALRLGRETDWREAGGGPVRGVGQRMFIVGDDAVPMMDLGALPVRRGVSGRAGPGQPARCARPVAAARPADRRRAGPAARSADCPPRDSMVALRNSVRRDLEALLNAQAPLALAGRPT